MSAFPSMLTLEFRGVNRDIGALIGRFGVTFVLSLLYGLIFFQACGKPLDVPSNFGAHLGTVAILLISAMFGTAQPTMLLFPFERPLFLREYSTGTCKPRSNINILK